jgi:hypothetical protein
MLPRAFAWQENLINDKPEGFAHDAQNVTAHEKQERT